MECLAKVQFEKFTIYKIDCKRDFVYTLYFCEHFRCLSKAYYNENKKQTVILLEFINCHYFYIIFIVPYGIAWLSQTSRGKSLLNEPWDWSNTPFWIFKIK